MHCAAAPLEHAAQEFARLPTMRTGDPSGQNITYPTSPTDDYSGDRMNHKDSETNRRLLHRARWSKTFGAYLPNHFLISMSASTPYFREGEQDPDPKFAPIFAHEYVHYLQNLTTLAGFKSFSFTQNLVPLFSRTLAKDGSSGGDSNLDTKLKSDLETICTIQLEHEGDSEVTPPGAGEFTIDTMDFHDSALLFRGQSAMLHSVTLRGTTTTKDGAVRQVSFELGAAAIEESLAYIFETQAAVALDVPPIPASEFPYRILERTVAHILGENPDLRISAILGTLALLAPHPAYALVTLTRVFLERRSQGLGSDAALEQIVTEQRTSLHAINDTLKADLDSIRSIHVGRGLLEPAVAKLASIFESAFQLRTARPLFDVDVFFPRFNMLRFVELLREIPPCDILQERPGSDDLLLRDLLLGFEDTSANERVFRILQAQQHYYVTHLDLSGEFSPSDKIESVCPFFTCCGVEIRRNSPEICRSSPWKTVQNTQTCWYGSAVAGTLGLVRIKKML
jgi:hypothetical protein